MAGGAGIPPGMRIPGAPESGGVARVRELNHRLQAAIPPGFVFKDQRNASGGCWKPSYGLRRSYAAPRRDGHRPPLQGRIVALCERRLES